MHSTIHKWGVIALIVLGMIPGAMIPIHAESQVASQFTEYMTISMAYEGKRKFLAVDTTALKSGIYRITAYEEACHAAMWQAGTPQAGAGGHGVQRTIKSIYIKDKVSAPNQNQWLTLHDPDGAATYSTLQLTTDSTGCVRWYVRTVTDRGNNCVEGDVYYFSNHTIDSIYRYLYYDGIYGFSRAIQFRPSTTARVAEWKRTVGHEAHSTWSPSYYSFDYNELKADTLTQRIAIYVTKDVDYFTNSYDPTLSFYLQKGTQYTGQAAFDQLHTSSTPKENKCRIDWRSTANRPGSSVHNTDFYARRTFYSKDVWTGTMIAHTDSAMMGFSNPSGAGSSTPYFDPETNELISWVHTTGASLVDRYQDAAGTERLSDFQDYAHLHLFLEQPDHSVKEFIDSVPYVRRSFYTTSPIPLTMSMVPDDYAFPYSTITSSKDIDVSLQYQNITEVRGMDNVVVSTTIGEIQSVDMEHEKTYRDTLRIPVIEGGDTIGWTEDILICDTLMYQLVPATETDVDISWVTVTLQPDRHTLRVVAQPAGENTKYARINLTYNYRHAASREDTYTVKRFVLLEQTGNNASASVVYQHQAGASGSALITKHGQNIQQVHEKVDTMYAIPGSEHALPLSRDYYGWYRWYDWVNNENDITIEPSANLDIPWVLNKDPRTNIGDSSFLKINTDRSHSQGRYAPSRMLAIGTPMRVPEIKVPTTMTSERQIACDVSAYTDYTITGRESKGTVTEPTLSYRQIFNLLPATVMADRMQTSKINANYYIYRDTITAPIGKDIVIDQPGYYKEDGKLSEIPYVYYCGDLIHPENVGLKSSVDGVAGYGLNNPRSYNRVSVLRDTTIAGKPGYTSLRLLTVNQIQAMTKGQSKTVMLVAPCKEAGYLMGCDGWEEKVAKDGKGFADKTTMDSQVREKMNTTMYLFRLECADATNKRYYIRATTNGSTYYYLDRGLGFAPWNARTGSTERYWEIVAPFGDWQDDGNLVINYSKNNNDSVFWLRTPYYSTSGDYKYYLYNWKNSKNSAFAEIDEKEIIGSDTRYQKRNVSKYMWCMYEKVETSPVDPHYYPIQETAEWQQSTDNGKTWSAVNTTTTGGYLKVSQKNTGTIHYRLVTHPTKSDKTIDKNTVHFKLAYYVVNYTDQEMSDTNNGVVYGPSKTPIISEEKIEDEYNVLVDILGSFAPPTSAEQQFAVNHITWTQSEFAYHYAPSVTTLDGKRIYSSTELQTGEYCFPNVYEGVESHRGAANSWMMCMKGSATESLCCINVQGLQVQCSDQETFLTYYVRKISGTDQLHLTTYVYGQNPSTNQWEEALRLGSGEIKQENGWQQVVFPFASEKLRKYKSFQVKIVALPTDAVFAFDNVRIMEKNKNLTMSQSQSRCLKNTANDSIVITMRYNMTHGSLPVGTKSCYQISKYNTSTGEYDVIEHNDIYPGLLYECLSPTECDYKDDKGHSFGMFLIPEHDYQPDKSSQSTYQSATLAAYCDEVEAKKGRIQLEGGGTISRREGYLNEEPGVSTQEEMESGEAMIYMGGNWYGKTKGYVYMEDTKEWWIYIMIRVAAKPGDKFRLLQTTINKVGDQPTFTSTCANTQEIEVKDLSEMRVDGAAWTNHTRSELTSSTLLAPNSVHVLDMLMEHPNPTGTGYYTGSIMYDMLTMFEEAKGYYETMDADQRAHVDTLFYQRNQLSLNTLFNAFFYFRQNEPDNTMRTQTNWSLVKPEDFLYDGGVTSLENAYTYYNAITAAINKGIAQIGLTSKDITIGSNQDLYYYVRPAAASGYYVATGQGAGGKDTTIAMAACDEPKWLEMHSNTANYALRYGNPQLDKTLVPIIRASKTEANTCLPVRVDTITYNASNPAETVILGWDSTQVIETNDPVWNNLMKDPDVSKRPHFRYYQDKIWQTATAAGYYKQDSVVYFKPIDAAHVTELTTNVGDGKNKWGIPIDNVNQRPGYWTVNNYTLRAGYWYLFKTGMVNGNLSPYTDGSTLIASPENDKNHTRMGEAYFRLYVAADTVIWAPKNASGSNYWDNDVNWDMVVDGQLVTSSTQVPMTDSKVIINTIAGQQYHLYPIVRALSNEELKQRDYGFLPGACRDVLFRAGTRMLGQEKLDYTRAFADKEFTTGAWTTYSAPLKDIHSGDMYVPADTANDMQSFFAPLTFEDPKNTTAYRAMEGVSSSAIPDRDYPNAFYQNFWNQSVNYVYYCTDEEAGKPKGWTTTTRSSAQWTITNTLDQSYAPGTAVNILSYDNSNEDGRKMTLRLPKQETTYYYYKNGAKDSHSVTISRSDFNALSNNLAYNKTDLTQPAGSSQVGVSYEVTNAYASTSFFFGNPTMALIDVYQLYLDNASKLAASAGNSITIQRWDKSKWISQSVTATGQAYIEPGGAVRLVAKTAATSLDLFVSTDALKLLPVVFSSAAPARKQKAEEKQDATLYIRIDNETNSGLHSAFYTLGERAWASDTACVGEDAEFLMSGDQNFDWSAAHTPLGLYSICQGHALSLDLRHRVENVPLALARLDEQYEYSDMTTFSFGLRGNWSHPLWLHDVTTGDSIQIWNGMVLQLTTPNDGAIRYYINYTGQQSKDVPTDIEHVEETSTKPSTDTKDVNKTYVYDILGHYITTLKSKDQWYSLSLPAGVYILQTGDQVTSKIVQ